MATALVRPTPPEGGGQKAVWIFFALQIHSPQICGAQKWCRRQSSCACLPCPFNSSRQRV